MSRIDTLKQRRDDHLAAADKLNAQIVKAEAATAEPKSVKQIVKVFIGVIAVLDGTEQPMRDYIERGLAQIAGLPHVRLGDYEAVTKRLMARLTVIRTRAMKKAFRYARAELGDEPILDHKLAVWAATILREDLKGIDTAIRTGLIAGLENTEVARKVVGTIGLDGGDGVTEYTRHKIAHLARAAVKAFRKANSGEAK